MPVTLKVLVGVLVTLVVVGGAGATAATLITGKQVKDGSLTGADIKDKSLTAKDFNGSVRGPQGVAGPQGLQGPPGAAGARGPAGTTPTVGVTIVDGDSVSVAAGATEVSADVTCPAGQAAVGGGGITEHSNAVLTDSYASGSEGQTPTGWTVFYRNDTMTAETVFARVVCAKIG